MKTNFWFLVVFLAACDQPNDSAAPRSLTKEQQVELLRDAELRDFKAKVAVTKGTDTIYAHSKTSDEGFVRGASNYELWEETFSAPFWRCTFGVDATLGTLKFYSGIHFSDHGESLELDGIEFEYDQTTKKLKSVGIDQSSYYGRKIHNYWSFYKVRPGERESKSWYALTFDSTMTIYVDFELNYK